MLLTFSNCIKVFSQTQHLNQLIDEVLPNFITEYNNTHNMDLVVINNQMPYRAAPSLPTKTRRYKMGKINGDLEDGYYCASPSIYFVSRDTLRIQFFLCSANKDFPGLGIGDTIIFYFVYQEQTGKWVFDNHISSHATWYRKGKFIGDFVMGSMEGCILELEKSKSVSRQNVYVIDDYLTLFVLEDSFLPNFRHIPEGHNIKDYCKSGDWLIGYPEIEFYNDTIAVSTKAFRAKDYKSDYEINSIIRYTLFYLYNKETQSWEICKKKNQTI